MDKPKYPAHASSVHQLATALKSLTGEVKLTLVKLLQCSVLLGNLKPRQAACSSNRSVHTAVPQKLLRPTLGEASKYH